VNTLHGGNNTGELYSDRVKVDSGPVNPMRLVDCWTVEWCLLQAGWAWLGGSDLTVAFCGLHWLAGQRRLGGGS